MLLKRAIEGNILLLLLLYVIIVLIGHGLIEGASKSHGIEALHSD